ncbi:helix-turn-helix transcriptional regulator [Kitasatospora indigofera]|uniref:helix-turn-helix transcriptional regulator n=1 Tax=Kitasatospora indigofera TaxID=67307 RepID=UPI0036CCBE7B
MHWQSHLFPKLPRQYSLIVGPIKLIATTNKGRGVRMRPKFHGPAADEWLTPREVAEMTKLRPQSLANHRWRGTGPAYTKLGEGRSGPIRYRRRDVENWLAGPGVSEAA